MKNWSPEILKNDWERKEPRSWFIFWETWKNKRTQEAEETKFKKKIALIKNKDQKRFALGAPESAEQNEAEGILNGDPNDTDKRVNCLVFSRINPLSKDWAALHQSELLAHGFKKDLAVPSLHRRKDYLQNGDHQKHQLEWSKKK